MIPGTQVAVSSLATQEKRTIHLPAIQTQDRRLQFLVAQPTIAAINHYSNLSNENPRALTRQTKKTTPTAINPAETANDLSAWATVKAVIRNG